METIRIASNVRIGDTVLKYPRRARERPRPRTQAMDLPSFQRTTVSTFILLDGDHFPKTPSPHLPARVKGKSF